MATEQNFSNHARYYPLFHFVVIPIFLLNFIFQAFRFYQEPGLDRGVWVVVCLGFILLALVARLMALKVQDRVIRLEERLRYRDLLPAELAEKASTQKVDDIIALRFASDAELADFIEKNLQGGFLNSKEIKRAVQNWRSDYLRV